MNDNLRVNRKKKVPFPRIGTGTLQPAMLRPLAHGNRIVTRAPRDSRLSGHTCVGIVSQFFAAHAGEGQEFELCRHPGYGGRRHPHVEEACTPIVASAMTGVPQCLMLYRALCRGIYAGVINPRQQ